MAPPPFVSYPPQAINMTALFPKIAIFEIHSRPGRNVSTLDAGGRGRRSCVAEP